MISLFKNSFYTFITQVISQIISILAGIFLTRLLGPYDRGLYAIFQSDVGLFTTILGFSVNLALIYFIAQNVSFRKINKYSLIFTATTLILSLIAFLILNLTPFLHIIFHKDFDVEIYFAFFVVLILTQLNTVYTAYFQGIQNFNAVNKITLINSFLNFICYLTAYVLFKNYNIQIKFFEVILISVCINLLIFFLNVYFFKNIFLPEVKADFRRDIHFKDFFTYLLTNHISIVINFFNYRLIIWIVSYYLTPEEVGYFSLALGLGILATFLSNPLSQVLFPYLSNKENIAEKNDVFVLFARLHFSLVLPIALLVFCVSSLLIPFLYGSEFIPSVQIFNILIWGMVFSAQTKIMATFLLSINQSKYNLYGTIIGLVTNVFLSVILVRQYQLKGAAFATLLTYLVIFLVVFISLMCVGKLKKINVFFISLKDFYQIKSLLFKRKHL
ncbi:MAG: flippase [Bacteroidales bacterium]|nr:flippase [Bacteroidales bacterium]